MTQRLTTAGAALMFFAVLLGAFGAHGLRERITPEAMAVYQTGVQYHVIHALALLLLAALAPHAVVSKWTPRLFCLGIFIFSGSLYLLAVTGQKWLGAITPIGGLCFLTGWALLFWANFATRSEPGRRTAESEEN